MLVGLTGSDGVTETTDTELQAQYRVDQGLFPMDYRLPFEEFDGLEVVVEGERDFQSRVGLVDDFPLVLPEARELYARAQNRRVHSARSERIGPMLNAVVRVTLSRVAHAV